MLLYCSISALQYFRVAMLLCCNIPAILLHCNAHSIAMFPALQFHPIIAMFIFRFSRCNSLQAMIDKLDICMYMYLIDSTGTVDNILQDITWPS